MPTPEELARQNIDALLTNCGWNFGDQPLIPPLRDQQFGTPDDGRKFTELYNVQHLQSAQLDRVSRVCISTIQRVYSMLRSLFSWIETLMPQGQITRGDRQRFMCNQS